MQVPLSDNINVVVSKYDRYAAPLAMTGFKSLLGYPYKTQGYSTKAFKTAKSKKRNLEADTPAVGEVNPMTQFCFAIVNFHLIFLY